MVNDTKPESVFVFVPAGEQPAAIMKTFAERGLTRAGSKKGTAPHRILPPAVPRTAGAVEKCLLNWPTTGHLLQGGARAAPAYASDSKSREK